MQRRSMYIEKGTGTNHDGPAWSAYLEFSRTGRNTYFNGLAFNNGKGSCHCVEKGKQFWISGVKMQCSNRHVFGRGKTLVSRDALTEFLSIKGWNQLYEENYDLFDARPTDSAKFNAMENRLFE